MNIVIAGVEVVTDQFGRYNLNALHKASGEGPNKKPGKWLEIQAAQDLIAALRKQAPSPLTGLGANSTPYEPLSVSHGGNAPGTFAHELLAVSYAGWISPEFQLLVNQTFIDYHKNKPKMSPAEIIIAQGQAMLAIEHEQARQAQRLASLEHRVDLMDGDTGYQTVTAYIRKHSYKVPLSMAKTIGQRAAKLAKDLGIQVGVVPDERWGTVNSYPIALLDEVIAEFLSISTV